MNDNLIQAIDSPAQTNKNTIIGRTNLPRISKIIPNYLLSLRIVLFIKSPYQFDIMCLGVV